MYLSSRVSLKNNTFKKAKIQEKVSLYSLLIMKLLTGMWLFLLLVINVRSNSVFERTRVEHTKQVLDYTLNGGTLDNNGGEAEGKLEILEDEKHFQRDIEDVDGHLAMYHHGSSPNVHSAGTRKVLNDVNSSSSSSKDNTSNKQLKQNTVFSNDESHDEKQLAKSISVIDFISSNNSSSNRNVNVYHHNSNNINDSKNSPAPLLPNNSNNIINNSIVLPKLGTATERQINPQRPKNNDQFVHQVVTSQQMIPKRIVNTSNDHEQSLDSGLRHRLPKAIIIGVKKAGTRALLEFLKMHPDVRAPGPEPHFFDKNYEKGYDWYRNQMPLTDEKQLTMEKTPSYYITKECPSRIYNMSSDTKLIVVVRDPVTRAISDYTQGLERRPDLKPFERMAFIDNNTQIVNISWTAIKIGMYIRHLEKWLKYFPLKQIHFVDGEKLISQPATELYKVQQFLAIRAVINDKYFSFNHIKGFPCLVKQPSNTKGRPHCLGNTKGRQHPKVSDKAIYKLKEFYTPFNQKLYIRLGHNFGW